MLKPKKTKSGFTLIELLIVISIIGVLVTIGAVSLAKSRSKARDIARVNDIRQIQTALQMYYRNETSFPKTITANQPLSGSSSSSTFMAKIPAAPSAALSSYCNSQNSGYAYATSSDGRSFVLSTCLGDTTGNLKPGIIISDNRGIIQSCGDYIIDYEGKEYRTIQIGTQCWMRDNLNVGTMLTVTGNNCANPYWVLRECLVNDNLIEKYCYSNNAANCLTDGGLYEWSEAMGFPLICNLANFRFGSSNCGTTTTYRVATQHRGICPAGWHLPSDTEWYTLESYLTDPLQTCSATRNAAWYLTDGWGCNSAGTKLKVGGSTSFDGVLAGFRNSAYNNDGGGEFNRRGSYGIFWLATGSHDKVAFDRALGSSKTTTNRYGDWAPSGLSIRCLKDYNQTY